MTLEGVSFPHWSTNGRDGTRVSGSTFNHGTTVLSFQLRSSLEFKNTRTTTERQTDVLRNAAEALPTEPDLVLLGPAPVDDPRHWDRGRRPKGDPGDKVLEEGESGGHRHGESFVRPKDVWSERGGRSSAPTVPSTDRGVTRGSVGRGPHFPQFTQGCIFVTNRADLSGVGLQNVRQDRRI